MSVSPLKQEDKRLLSHPDPSSWAPFVLMEEQIPTLLKSHSSHKEIS
jgi:hypothetical protein